MTGVYLSGITNSCGESSGHLLFLLFIGMGLILTQYQGRETAFSVFFIFYSELVHVLNAGRDAVH